MDTFLAGIALPNMMGTFSTTLDEISWILTAYLVAVAVFTPLTAWLGRRYGRKRVLLTGIVGFVVASTFAGTSNSLFEIVTARFIQGVFGATLIPVAQQILLDLWPKERHNIALGWFSVGMMVGLIIGPVLGGFLTEYYSWRWNFFVNIPGGLIAFTLIFLFVRENKPDPSRHFDLTGFMLLGTALICMQWVLDRGEQLAWFDSDEIILWTSISLCSLYLFIVHIVTARRPFVDPALFPSSKLSWLSRHDVRAHPDPTRHRDDGRRRLCRPCLGTGRPKTPDLRGIDIDGHIVFLSRAHYAGRGCFQPVILDWYSRRQFWLLFNNIDRCRLRWPAQ